jgi:heme exporter protein B
MLRDATLIAGKDLRLEARSRVVLSQVAPFALLVLVLFAFALDPDRGVLARASAGLFWVAVLFCGVLAIQRSFSIESVDGNRDALRLAGLDPAGLFLGKAAAVALQLLAVELVLGVGVALLYDTATEKAGTVGGLALVVSTAVAATVGIAAASSLYGALAAGLRVRETLLPLLLLPALAPVLIGATQAFEAAFEGQPADGWPWVAWLGLFAVVYVGIGLTTFGPLMEDS